jgi:hypothetical protein
MRKGAVGAAAGLDAKLARGERRQQARLGVHEIEIDHRRPPRGAGGGLGGKWRRRGQLRGGAAGRQQRQQERKAAGAGDQSQPFRLK